MVLRVKIKEVFTPLIPVIVEQKVIALSKIVRLVSFTETGQQVTRGLLNRFTSGERLFAVRKKFNFLMLSTEIPLFVFVVLILFVLLVPENAPEKASSSTEA